MIFRLDYGDGCTTVGILKKKTEFKLINFLIRSIKWG